MSSNVVLIDFVNTVPQPVTAALVQSAPLVAAVCYVLQVVSWKRSWYSSWLVIAFWWAICLLVDFTFRYLLPIVIAALGVMLYASSKHKSMPPTTEQTLQDIMADVTTIRGLLPPQPVAPPPKTTLRIAAFFYVPYLIATYVFPLHILFGLFGTFLLTARAPFIHIIISTLSRSAWLRWFLRHLISRFTGELLPSITLSHQPMPATPTPVPSLRFLFTIYENQRWWMGLDWTAALLPNERPSWCTPEPAHQPVAPPNAFILPSPTTVYLKDGKGRRIKRTASWFWEEPEWKVNVRREGSSLRRVERPIPIPEENANVGGGPRATGSRLLKAAGKMRESGIMGRGNTDGQGPGDTQEDRYDEEEDQYRTDGDGWVYGDNKWEGSSSKGGIGKYTRFRRWTRVAVVSEVVELTEDGPLGVETFEGRPQPSDGHVYAMGTLTTRSDDDDESLLRQRLRRALSKSSNSDE